ncbi:DNA repair protein like [Actinidia chinensis var. chinensis]|uniref:DNA repair protein like n=1 Tax=Actinidia chinensis var. chinensis TaxID=1590841 RepID=A0A2R6R049_ACTCC|nr:DNA repair protein like [Actinidia chinensis var. chinensis]
MQASEMRSLRTLYAQHLRNLIAQWPPPPSHTFISCKSSTSPNPNFSQRKTIYSTSNRLANGSSAESEVPKGWTSSTSWDTHSDSRTETNHSVSPIYDPVTGRLVARRATKPTNNEAQESESRNGDESSKERAYGGVRTENLVSGLEQGLGFGDVSESGNRDESSKERTYGGVRRENVASGSEQGVMFGDFVGNRKKGKSKTTWVCSSCGNSDGQWWGTCRYCKSVGTFVKLAEGVSDGEKTSGYEVSEKVARSWLPQQQLGESVPLRLTDVNRGINQTDWRIPLVGLFGTEVARVLGGGLVPGSLVLIGGDPGVGKSTLLLQIAGMIAEGHAFGKPAPVVYVSGEESVEQIGNRADRMRIGTKELYLYSSTDIEDILEKIQPLSPRALIVDSIQTVYLRGVTGSAGGLPQVKECTSALLRFAKKTSIPVLLTGHVTKSGDIAGPRVLEHIVDVVLYMEGEKHSAYRLLRSVKNRFGSTDELGVFEMAQSGLQAVSNPSEMFLSEQPSDSDVLAGLAVAAIMDGSRTFLIEIQALCVPGSSISKQVNGVQASRADMIISVLKKQAGLKLQDNGIYLNVVSGVTLTETSGDLAIAAAICSSFLEFPIPNSVAFIGEIGLGGELRPVPRMEKRVNTVTKLGYKKCVVPKSSEKSLSALGVEGTTIVGCRNLKDMINTVFTKA